MKKNIFDLTLLEGPIRSSLEKEGCKDEARIEEIQKAFDERIQKDLIEGEKWHDRMSQERSFNVEVFGRRLYGDLQFLLIQTGKYNIFQAIGYAMYYDSPDGTEIKHIKWGHYNGFLPCTVLHWDPDTKQVKIK